MKRSMSVIPVLLVLTISVSCAPPSQSTAGSQTRAGKTTPVLTIQSTQAMQTTQTMKTAAVKPEPPEAAEIRFEKIAMIGKPDEEGWHEVTDQAIITQISKIIPDSASYETKSAENKGDIFQAIIPLEIDQGTANEISGVLKGLIKDPAVVKKYAELFKSDFSKITDPAIYLAGVSQIYQLGLVLAVEFILSESNLNLDKMDSELKKISEFQNREFKSKIMSSHSEVKELTTFSFEIVGNEELRGRKLQVLEQLKSRVIQLLAQVNLAITETASKSNIEFPDYAKNINDEAVLIDHQRILTNILEEISNLMFVFSQGNTSSDLSFAAYYDYIEQSNDARAELTQWHEEQIKAFGIDLLNKKVLKQGIEGIVSVIPGVFNKDWTKKELDDAFIQKIADQTKNPAFVAGQPRFLTGTNVRIIIMNGKYYYLPGKKA